MRKHVPPSVRDEVLREAGYMCGNPRCRHILTLELHHIEWVKDGGGNSPTNLLALCPNCHALHTAGHIPTSAVRHWKGILQALNHAFNREGMDLLLFLAQPNTADHWYSGDGILKFAGLIAAGLVRVSSSAIASMITMKSVPSSSHRVALTEKGQALVEAWLSGNEEQYGRLLANSPKEAS